MNLNFFLPQIYDGLGRKIKLYVPDMDVYFTINNDIYFIESKFLECCKYSDKPSISYYENNKGDDCLLKRYHNSNILSVEIPKFIKDIYHYLEEKNLLDVCDWFYPEQEITHLIGISLYLLENLEVLEKIKTNSIKLHFFNVIYKMENDVRNTDIENFRNYFILRAKKCISEMFSIDLDYQVKYSQDFIIDLLNISPDKLDTIGYYTDKKVIDLLDQFKC